MVSKPFYWSSCGIETPACKSFEEAAFMLPNSQEILSLADIITLKGIPRGKWAMGAYKPPVPLTEEFAAILGVSVSDTRTKILDAAKTKNRMDIFNLYNASYNYGLATQHTCDFILNTDGTLTDVNPL